MKLRLPKKRRYRFYLYLLSTFLILLAIDLLWVRLWRHIEISYDTTRLTAPLGSDGTPDYSQALDNIAGAGVTAENNAVPLLLSAVGPLPEKWPLAPAIYARLHINPPPAQGHYIIDYTTYIRQQNPSLKDDDPFWLEVSFAYSHPWTKADHPQLAAWIEACRQPLEFLDAASRRSHYYFPGPHIHVPPPHSSDPDFFYFLLSENRSLAYAAIARAMLRAGTGDFVAAHADLMAVHRLARLIQQEKSLIFFSYFLDYSACLADQAMAQSEKLPSPLARQFLQDLEALPPLSSFAEVIDEPERYSVLNQLIDAAHHGFDLTKEERDFIFEPTDVYGQIFDPETPCGKVIDHLVRPSIPVHFNAALRHANQTFDAYVAALHLPTFPQRRERANILDRAHPQRADLAFNGFFQPAELRLTSLINGVGRADAAYTRAVMNNDLARLAFALAAYYAEHAAYPESLSTLAPAYLSSIPNDLFLDTPLHYTRTPTGFLLYSVGWDQKDAGGHNFDNPDPKYPQASNLVVRVGPYPTTQPGTK